MILKILEVAFELIRKIDSVLLNKPDLIPVKIEEKNRQYAILKKIVDMFTEYFI